MFEWDTRREGKKMRKPNCRKDIKRFSFAQKRIDI